MKKNKNKTDKFTKLLAISIATMLLGGAMCTKVFASPTTDENVTSLINQERAKRDLPKLNLDTTLNNAAANKSKDMLNRSYFEHFAYNLTPWDFIAMAGYNYLYAGENLAMDFDTSEGMVTAWMNSPLHRENILNPDYTDMGLGIVKGAYTENGSSHQTIMVDNMFGREKPALLKIFDVVAQAIANIF